MLRRLALVLVLAGLPFISAGGCGRPDQPTLEDGNNKPKLKPLANPEAPGGGKAGVGAN